MGGQGRDKLGELVPRTAGLTTRLTPKCTMGSHNFHRFLNHRTMQGNYYHDILPPPPMFLMLVKVETPSNQFHLLSRSSFLNDGSFDALISSGNAVPVHRCFEYIILGIETVAEQYKDRVPGLEKVIKRSLHECAVEFWNLPFARQRCRFIIFEYFARMATRYLVAQRVATFTDWTSHDDVLSLKRNVMASWYQWFVQDGVHRNNEANGFSCEIGQLYIQLQEDVFDPDSDDDE